MVCLGMMVGAGHGSARQVAGLLYSGGVSRLERKQYWAARAETYRKRVGISGMVILASSACLLYCGGR
jgi:hypothetical protein